MLSCSKIFDDDADDGAVDNGVDDDVDDDVDEFRLCSNDLNARVKSELCYEL